MWSRLRCWRLYSCSRLICTSKSAAGFTATPTCALMSRARSTLFACFTAMNALFLHVARPFRIDLLEEAFVDLEDELEMPRQDLLKKGHAPFLQRLGKQGVIGVGKRACDQRPGFLPGHAVFVVEEPLQFDDG